MTVLSQQLTAAQSHMIASLEADDPMCRRLIRAQARYRIALEYERSRLLRLLLERVQP